MGLLVDEALKILEGNPNMIGKTKLALCGSEE